MIIIKHIKPLILCGFLIFFAFCNCKLFASNSYYYFALAEMEMETGNYAKADSFLQIAQKLDPNSIEILKELFTALYYQGKYEEIIDAGKKAIKNNLTRAGIYRMIAESYRKLRDLKNAEKYFKKCLKITSEKGKVYLDLYELAIEQEKNKKAMKYLAKAEEYAGNNLNLIYWIAIEYSRQRDETKFIELLERTVALKQDFIQINIWLADFYFKNEKYEKAIPHIKAVMKRGNLNINSYFMLATIYNKTGALQDEIAVLEKGVNHFPENADLLNWLGYTLADNDIRQDYALTLLKKAISIDSTNVYIWDSVAWAYYKLGKYENALESMKLVLEQDIRDTTIRYHLGNIYWKLGKIESAKKNWNMAIDMNNDEETKMLSEEMLKKLEESNNEN